MDPATGIYSCDDHLDLSAVPPELWQSRLPRALAERGPHVVDARRQAGVGVRRPRHRSQRDRRSRARSQKQLSAIGRAGIEDDGYRAGTPKLRLEDMDRDGLWASVIYGPLALGLPIDDPELQDACFAAWNDWAVEEFNAVAPDRLCVLAFLPGHSPEAAAAELERARRARAPRRDHRRLRHRRRRPGLGPAVGRRASTPVCRSASTSRAARRRSSATGSASGSRPRSRRCCRCSSTSRSPPWCSAARSNGTRASSSCSRSRASAGCRTSWRAWTCEWRALRDKLDYAPSIPPSDLFRRQVYATFEEDALGRAAHPAPRRRLVHVGVRLPAHRQHVPQLAARDRGDAGCAARRRPPQDHRDQLRPAVRLRRCREPDSADRRLRPCLAADAGHRRDGGVLSRARVRRRRAAAVVSVYVGQPDDQPAPPGDSGSETNFTLRAPAA